MNDTGANALFLALLLILPLASLVARRLPLRSVVRMALAWIAIFAVALVIIAGRHQLAAGWSAITRTVTGDNQTATGGTVRIGKADDGHFWATATINGVRRRMLVDSGATYTAISSATAAAAQLDLGESPFGSILSTANGKYLWLMSSKPTLPAAAKAQAVARIKQLGFDVGRLEFPLPAKG